MANTATLAPGTQMAADVDAHQADLERRAKEREKKQPELMRCLDPDYAAKKEAQKPTYRYRVTCTTQRPTPQSYDETVEAKDESEAWAKFCDRIRTWPGPKYCNRKIEAVTEED